MGEPEDRYAAFEAKLEKMGREGVRVRLAQGRFNAVHISQAAEWLDRQDRAERDAVREAQNSLARSQLTAAEQSVRLLAFQAAEAAEANRLAREANEIARSARDKAQTANTIATAAMIVAIITAVVMAVLEFVQAA